MTVLSGFVASFWQLALARVGVGEASCLPAGRSMISDRFPQERRTLAMSVFSVSFPVGIMTSLVLAGWLGIASDALQPRFGAGSLRYALLVNGGVALWAALHFALGARSLRLELERA